MSSREATASSSVCRVASRSSSIACRLPGIRDDDLEDVVLERVRNRHCALEGLHGDELRRLDRDTHGPEVDERKMVTGREHARDAVPRRGALVDERLVTGLPQRSGRGRAPARPARTSAVRPRRSSTSSAVSLTPNGAPSCCAVACLRAAGPGDADVR